MAEHPEWGTLIFDYASPPVQSFLISSACLFFDEYHIDGIRVELENGWVLVRPSGTEAKVRITAEARENVDGIYEMAEKIVKEALK